MTEKTEPPGVRREGAMFLVAAAVVLAALLGLDWITPAGIIVIFALCAGLVYWRSPSAPVRVETPAPASVSLPPPAVDDGESLIARAALDRVPDPLIVVNELGRIVLANPAASNLFGKAMAGKHISRVIRTPIVLEAVTEVLHGTSGRTVDYSEMVPVERYLRAFAVPFQLERAHRNSEQSDEGYHVLVGLRDLTEIKRAEQTRADFVAHASHELRTPLSSLAGFIETLRGHAKNDEEARDRFLAIMQVQAERMGRLIQDLLSLSRIEMNEHVPPDGTVDLGDVVNDTVDALAQLAHDARAELVLTVRGQTVRRIPHGAVEPVIGQRDELVQVIQNLVDNAIKYGRHGGKVVIDVGVAASALAAEVDSASYSIRRSPFPAAGAGYVAVRDEGDGIPRDQLPRLTERFYRVDVKRSREEGGTGLGLAIVKHIVNRHRGWLTIESEPGRGSVFTIFVPLIPRETTRVAGTPTIAELADVGDAG